MQCTYLLLKIALVYVISVYIFIQTNCILDVQFSPMISQKTLRRLYSSCLFMGENIAEFLRIVQINRKCK